MENLQETNENDIRIYGFNTDDKELASACLILYSIYKSRNIKNFQKKVKKDYWGRIEEFIKKASRSSTSIENLIQNLKKEFECNQIYKMFMKCDFGSNKIAIIDDNSGNIIIPNIEAPIYITSIIKHLDNRNILNIFRFKTSYIVLLLQERIDIEKSLEKLGFINTKFESDDMEDLVSDEK